LFRMIIPQFPGFNVYSHVASKTTAVGPLYVATAVAQLPGWDVEVIDENNYRYPGPVDEHGSPDHRLLQAMRPADAVGFYGSLSSTIPRLFVVAAYYQALGVFTVAGGHHFLDEEECAEGLQHGLDVIVHGEGEYAIQELLPVCHDRAAWSQLGGLSFLRDGVMTHTPPRPPIADIDALPFPDFALIKYAKLSVIPLSRTRGCGMDCEFCAIKGAPRWGSPDKLFANMVQLIERHHCRNFFVVDDLFTQDRAGVRRFCELAIAWQQATGKRLDLSVQIRLDVAKDRDLLRLMRRAGVLMVAIGYESVLDAALQAMDKHIRAADMLALTRVYRDEGFLVHGMFIFGYPMQPGTRLDVTVKDQVRAYKQFIRRAHLDTIQVLLPVPLPGTALRRRLMREQRIYPREIIGWEYYDGNFPLFEPDPPLTADTQQQAMRAIMGGFYHFSHMMWVGVRTLTFPLYFIPLFNFRAHWEIWYRPWRNNIRGFGGWLLLRRWTDLLQKRRFSRLLADARKQLQGH
ncbi:MAG TPA: radical SAM protein, partial [bacterium]|nr:radical SAM protein [bacterium]